MTPMSMFWTEGTDGLKEERTIYVHLEKPSLNKGGGLRHHLSATYTLSWEPPQAD